MIILDLNADAMVNLNKMNLNFRQSQPGIYGALLTIDQLNSFLELNDCIIDGDSVLDVSQEFKGEVWGTVVAA
jgi:hypothetical protein